MIFLKKQFKGIKLFRNIKSNPSSQPNCLTKKFDFGNQQTFSIL